MSATYGGEKSAIRTLDQLLILGHSLFSRKNDNSDKIHGVLGIFKTIILRMVILRVTIINERDSILIQNNVSPDFVMI